MRVLLGNPRFDGSAEVPPLGLLCLASVLIGDGVETRVIDLDVPGLDEPQNALRASLSEFCPAVLGVTSTSRNYDCALQVINCARDCARQEAHRRFRHRPLFEQQRVYFELGCLDEILSEYPE